MISFIPKICLWNIFMVYPIGYSDTVKPLIVTIFYANKKKM